MSASEAIDPSDRELDSEAIPRGGSASQKSLGMEIILTAAADYRIGSVRNRASASAFLFPETGEYRAHLKLICSITNVDPRWLREELDRARPEWDREWRRGETDDSKETKEAA
jgi:hypothetical protein